MSLQDDSQIGIWKTLIKIDEKLKWIAILCLAIAIGVWVIAGK